MKRWIMGMAGVVAAAVWAQEGAEVSIQAELTLKKDAGSTESVTIVQPGPAGTTSTITRTVTTVEKDRAPRPDVPADNAPRKARVAVIPAIFAQDARQKAARELNEKLGLTDPTVIENPGYTSFLVDALVNCRKFDVLEREDLRAAIKELDFGESDYADLAKVVRVGNMLNADYVVIPEIRYLGVVLEQKDVPYVGKQTQRLKAKLSTSVRTVDVKTTKIVASAMADTGVTNRLRKAEESPGSPVRDLIDGLYGQSALKVTAAIIDTAYPIRVVAVGEASCVLNRGEGAVREGEMLNVYRPGEVMTDPETKEVLGYHEARVGRIRVVKVDEKTCTAEILEGGGSIEKLNIVRRDVKAEGPVESSPAPKLD